MPSFCSCVVAAGAYAQLPPVIFPPENPYSGAKAVLGKILFWEEQMSSDNIDRVRHLPHPDRGRRRSAHRRPPATRTPGPTASS